MQKIRIFYKNSFTTLTNKISVKTVFLIAMMKIFWKIFFRRFGKVGITEREVNHEKNYTKKCKSVFQCFRMMLPPDPVFIFKGEMNSVSCLSFKVSSEVEYIYAGTTIGKVHVWNLNTKREIGNFSSGEDVCISINIPENHKDSVITQNKTGSICFWEEKEKCQWLLLKEVPTNFFGFCKCFIFQEILYTALKECFCQAISLLTKENLKIFKLSDGSNFGEIMALKTIMLKEKTYILTAYENPQLILWSLENVLQISKLQLLECPMALDFDTKTKKGICGSPSNDVLIFSINKDLELIKIKILTLVNPGVAAVQIRPDSKLVAIGCWDGKIKLYSWKTFVLLAVLDTHILTLQDICFFRSKNESGKIQYLMAAGSKDSSISLWDIYN